MNTLQSEPTPTSGPPDVIMTVRASAKAKADGIKFTGDGHYYDESREDHATHDPHVGTFPEQTFTVDPYKGYPASKNELTKNGFSWYVNRSNLAVTIESQRGPNDRRWVADNVVPRRPTEEVGYYSLKAEYPNYSEPGTTQKEIT